MSIAHGWRVTKPAQRAQRLVSEGARVELRRPGRRERVDAPARGWPAWPAAA